MPLPTCLSNSKIEFRIQTIDCISNWNFWCWRSVSLSKTTTWRSLRAGTLMYLIVYLVTMCQMNPPNTVIVPDMDWRRCQVGVRWWHRSQSLGPIVYLLPQGLGQGAGKQWAQPTQANNARKLDTKCLKRTCRLVKVVNCSVMNIELVD